MTHQEIQDNEVIERYVRHKLTSAERQAFQEHYFNCDECFEQTQITARFIAGVREASRSGVLAADRAGRIAVASGGWLAALFNQRWAMPALATGLLLAVTLIGWWALSLRRENQLLAQRTSERTSEEARTTERLQRLESQIRELEAREGASQSEKESLKQEISRLKEQLAATERPQDTQVARLRPPDINVPVRNVYPLDDVQRSGRTDENDQLRLPRGTRSFVLLLGDYKPGYPNYRLEVRNPSGRVVARRAGLKPDQNGELSVLLDRTQLSPGKYRLTLYGAQEKLAEYVVEVE